MDVAFAKPSLLRYKNHFISSSKTNVKASVIRYKRAFSSHENTLQMHLKLLDLLELSHYLAWFEFNRFELTEICHGGSSSVYKGVYTWPESDRTGKTVFALKEFDQSMIKEVILNVHLFNRCLHNPTIKIYGLTHNEKTNKYMMVTECGDNSLDNWQSTTDGTWSNLVSSWHLLASYLIRIHQMGILHQDLHPGNIVYVKGVPQFIDTGLSTLRTHPKTSHSAYGCLAYLPPEVLKGQRYNSSSEVYCLGTLFWQMVTGVPPRGTAHDRRRDGLREDPIPGMPKPLADLIRDCWYEVPARRPTMSQVLKRCRAMMNESIVSSPIPASTKEFVVKLKRRACLEKVDDGFTFPLKLRASAIPRTAHGKPTLKIPISTRLEKRNIEDSVMKTVDFQRFVSPF